jgi:O-acetyl-ADP-ribose deacetylase (regulator of RNase III)
VVWKKIDLVQVIQLKKIKSLALPPLGCGLGGLSWASVKPCIEEYLSVLTDVHIIVFEPQGAPAADKMAAQVKVSGMTPGRAALLELMHRYLGGLLDPFVTLLEAHKLMYFLQESGEDLRLKYAKAPYGPYAENLRHVFNAIEGHFISGYADGGDLPNKRLELFPEAVAKAREYLLSSQKTSARLERVADLVTGFESPSGLELLSTVHWTVKKEKISEKEEVISYIHSWSERKKRFSSRQIDIALNVLSQKGWISYSDK